MLPIRRANFVRNKCRLAAFSIFTMALVSSSAQAAVMPSDDFNDGNDSGWSHYDPFAEFGGGGTWSFPNGAYRIQLPPAPGGGAFGPARGGSVNQSDTYEDFFVSVDVVDWDETLNQAFGILTRVGTPGLGTTTGYAFSYSTHVDTGR